MVIQHNILAQNAAYIQKDTNAKLAKSTKKLASGFKIGSAADDAAHLSISEKMRAQIRGLNRGTDNISEGIGYCQTADGALEEVENMLQRMNELSIEAANGTCSESDRQAIDDEIQQLKTEIERICVSTKYNEAGIFQGDVTEEEQKEKYHLSFFGIATDLYIYNDSYDPATHTATYGGIAYQGKRYAWSTISPNMYDPATGTFREGKYSLQADDGTRFTFISKDGATPPRLEREYSAKVNESGIMIGGETILWENVLTKDGDRLDPNDIKNETYHFTYCGLEVSFTPDIDDEFSDVVSRLNETIWRSDNQIPTEKTALFADFSGSKMNFDTDQQVRDMLAGAEVDFGLKLRAGDGTNGTIDGVWLERNGILLAGSEKSWAELGISNWGDLSEDIWDDLKYEYLLEDGGIKTIQFRFHLINEISKDSAIQALNDADLKPTANLYLDNGVEVEFNPTDDHLVGMEKTSDHVNMSLAMEYALGRDYTTKVWTSASTSFMYAGAGNDMNRISWGYNRDGVETVETFDSAPNANSALTAQIKDQIMASFNQQLAVIKARYLAGVTSPEKMSLSEIVGAGNITGGGTNTYLQDIFTLDSSDPNWKSTQRTLGSENLACASIDFSDMGSTYELKDLIGTGFNATCATCNNHYSVQFATDRSVTGIDWKSVVIEGKNYRYGRVDNGSDYTIFVDLDSMEQNGKTDGVSFSNTLVDLMGASGYAFHYNQYATNVNDAKLVLFDNRPEYAETGVSTAQRATFSPFAFDFNTLADFEINMRSVNSGDFTLHYQYDFSNLFEHYKPTANLDPNGDYVWDGALGRYVAYDPGNPAHQGLDRYDEPDVELDTQGQDFNTYVEDFIKNKILQCALGGTSVKLKSNFSGLYVSGNANDNEAMVIGQNTPRQILPKKMVKGLETLKIQSSSNARDALYIPKQKLSLSHLGIKKCNVLTESAANKAIRMVDVALKRVNDVRGGLGAYQNRLEHSKNINENTAENTQSAESLMRDTDMAKEMVRYSTLNLIQQAGQSILTQANQQPDMVLNLLQ